MTVPANDLGQVLRAWRDRVSPESVGLPAGGRRRAAGLRREELAMLAGLSADYVTRLEQGRATNPSGQVLAALARALQLSVAERDHLFRVGGVPAPRAGQMPVHLTPGVQRLLRRLDEFPASVHDAAWNIVAWNHAWAALMGDPSRLRGRQRNIAWRHFTAGERPLGANTGGDPDDSRGHAGESGEPGIALGFGSSAPAGTAGSLTHIVRPAAEIAAFEAEIAGDLRVAAGTYPDDDSLRALIRDLREASPRFRELWESGVAGEHAANRKVIRHPQAGLITVDCDVFTVQGSALRVIVYTAEPGSVDAEKLAMVRVIGLQSMTTA